MYIEAKGYDTVFRLLEANQGLLRSGCSWLIFVISDVVGWIDFPANKAFDLGCICVSNEP